MKVHSEDTRERACLGDNDLALIKAMFSRLSQHYAFGRGMDAMDCSWLLKADEFSLSDESSSSPGRQMSSDGGQPCQSDTDSSVEESDFDTMPDIESDKNVIRTKVAPSAESHLLRGQKI